MSPQNAPREFTTEEIREQFLDHIRDRIKYWAKQPGPVEDQLDGLAFTILVALDGDSSGCPGFSVAVSTHPDDLSYHQGKEENWYPQNHLVEEQLKGQIAGSLHDLWYKKKQ